MPSSIPELRQLIIKYLQEAHLAYKEHGERLSVARGSSVVFLKPSEGPHKRLIVELLAPVLKNVDGSADLYASLNAQNGSLYFGTVYHHERSVWVSHTLIASHLDGEELIDTVAMVGTVADKLDDELKAKFGGTRWVDG